MEKSKILEDLREAKISHQKWLQRAKLLIKGVSINKEDIPVNEAKCKFGQWLYGDAQKLIALPNNTKETIKKIEELHSKLHDSYLKIFTIFFEDNRNFLAKFFNPTKTVSAKEQRIAEDYYKQLEDSSKKLIDEIERLERKIIVLPAEEIEKIF